MDMNGAPEETAADAAAYEQAVDIYHVLLTFLNAVIDREADPAKAQQLRADAERYAGERRQLHATDQAAVYRVITEYPAIVRQLRTALTE